MNFITKLKETIKNGKQNNRKAVNKYWSFNSNRAVI